MSTVSRIDPFPKAPLVGAAAVLLLALAAAGLGRVVGGPAPEATAATVTPTAEIVLRFQDRADGAVVVTRAGDARPLAVETGENGFLRGTLRGLARARRQEGLGRDAPFRLAAWPDGRLTLDDLATGRHVELAAFGPTNEAVFARLLIAAQGAPRMHAP